MKILIVYSSLTGNTKKIADGLVEALSGGCDCVRVQEAPAPDDYDLIIPGFWVDKGLADKDTLVYLEKIKNKKTAFFFTLGAYPHSEHADEVAADTEKRLTENGNTVLGHFRCQGKVDPDLLERMKKMLPPDHPHAQMSPERQARLDEAAKHPDGKDVENAKTFISEVMGRCD